MNFYNGCISKELALPLLVRLTGPTLQNGKHLTGMPYIQAMIPGKKTKPLDYLFLWLPNFAGQIRLFGVKLKQADCCIADYTYILDLLISLDYISIRGAQQLHKNLAGNRFGHLLASF